MEFSIAVTFICLPLFICPYIFVWSRLKDKVGMHISSSNEPLIVNWKPATYFVRNPEGMKIAYWYKPVQQPKAVIILIHGYCKPGGKRQMLSHANYLLRTGYSVALMDLRSFGESEGNLVTLGLHEWKDVEAVYDELKKLPENKDKKIGFMGVSMGASTALVTAGATGKGDFIIASVPYKSIRSMFLKQIKSAGFPPYLLYPFMALAATMIFRKLNHSKQPLSVAENISIPSMVISAKRDMDVNPKDALDLFELIPGKKVLWEVDSGHDVYRAFPDEFEERVTRFLQSVTQ